MSSLIATIKLREAATNQAVEAHVFDGIDQTIFPTGKPNGCRWSKQRRQDCSHRALPHPRIRKVRIGTGTKKARLSRISLIPHVRHHLCTRHARPDGSRYRCCHAPVAAARRQRPPRPGARVHRLFGGCAVELARTRPVSKVSWRRQHVDHDCDFSSVSTKDLRAALACTRCRNRRIFTGRS